MRAIILTGFVGTLLISVVPAGAVADSADGALPRSCAVRDLAVFTLIEKHGEAESLKPQVLADAFFEVLAARRACRDGRTSDALGIYDRVGAKLTGGGNKAMLHTDP
jgi:hypothetical protein